VAGGEVSCPFCVGRRFSCHDLRDSCTNHLLMWMDECTNGIKSTGKLKSCLVVGSCAHV